MSGRKLITMWIIPALLWAGVAVAQPIAKFDKQTFDMGTVQESEGPVSHYFRFTNIGDEPLKIDRVNTSCGCTSPDWTNSPVDPGERGYVKAVYDPTNRSGKFNNVIWVHTNAGRYMLRLRGETERNEDLVSKYRHEFGSLRAMTPNFTIGRAKSDDKKATGTIRFYNDSERRIMIGRIEGPEHIRFLNIPLSINPGSEGVIEVEYNAKKKGELGFVFDHVAMYTDDKVKPVKEFKVSAHIMPNVDPNADPATSPRLKFESNVINLGHVMEGNKASGKVKITNAGGGDLQILRVLASCGCTASEPEKDVLAPGESTFIHVTLDSKGRVGTNSQTVRVYSNDNKNPVQVLNIQAEVIESIK